MVFRVGIGRKGLGLLMDKNAFIVLQQDGCLRHVIQQCALCVWAWQTFLVSLHTLTGKSSLRQILTARVTEVQHGSDVLRTHSNLQDIRGLLGLSIKVKAWWNIVRENPCFLCQPSDVLAQHLTSITTSLAKFSCLSEVQQTSLILACFKCMYLVYCCISYEFVYFRKQHSSLFSAHSQSLEQTQGPAITTHFWKCSDSLEMEGRKMLWSKVAGHNFLEFPKHPPIFLTELLTFPLSFCQPV